MAIDNRLQVFNEEGQSVDYDILASDVKFLPDGKDLPTKLAEMEQEIEEAGSGDGTVTGVKVGSTTYPPNGEGVVDISQGIPDVSGKANKSEMSVVPGTGANADKTTITLKEGTNATVLTQHQDISGKVDKEAGKVLIPSTDLAKLQNLPTADQLAQQLGTKANDNAVVKSISVNGQTPQTPQNGNVNIQVQGGLTKEDISVETQGDGTVDINVGSGANKDTYTINLNHTHEGMAKLIVCEESDLPSTLDPATIYAITDSSETEIEKLIIRGMEFAGGGGTPSTEPKIVSPIGTQIDFNGESTKTVTVRALNLSEALTIAVTGVTANLQTISVNDAANGVQLTLTRGQNSDGGTLRIYSSEVDKSWNVIDSQAYSQITAVKFTKQQWMVSDIYPGPNSKIEFDMKFDGEKTQTDSNTTSNLYKCNSDNGAVKAWAINTTGNEPKKIVYYMNAGSAGGGMQQHDFTSNLNSARSTFIWDNLYSNSDGKISFLGENITDVQKKTSAMDYPMYICGDPSGKPYGHYDVLLYGIKHYENGVLAHDYVPVSKGGVAGLLDLVNYVFIHSASGTEVVGIEQ